MATRTVEFKVTDTQAFKDGLQQAAYWGAFQYSEWLDSQGLMNVPEGDQRTHEELVKEWQASR